MDVEKELKHWGILGMHWGIRRFQNEDGSLTPAGRERYGVGLTGHTRGLNDASSLSNEELRNMEKRYRNQANYYNARNNYLFEQQRYAELTAPKKKQTSQFMRKVFVEPFQNVAGKTNEAVMGYMNSALIGSIFGEGAENFIENYYYKSLYGGGGNKNKDKDGDDKQKDNKKKDELQKPQTINNTYNYYNQPDKKQNQSAPKSEPKSNKKNSIADYTIDFDNNTTIDIGDGFWIDVAKAIDEGNSNALPDVSQYNINNQADNYGKYYKKKRY